jgi:hypothetical protein
MTSFTDLTIFFLSAVLGGFALGFLFLGYFQNLTRSHGYIIVIASIAFWINLIVTAAVVTDFRITRAFPGLVSYLVMYSSFVTAGFIGRNIRTRLKKPIKSIKELRKEGGDRTDTESDL